MPAHQESEGAPTGGLPGCGGLTLFDALDLLAEERRR